MSDDNIPSCSYQLVKGLHYRKGLKWPSLAEKEVEEKECQDGEPVRPSYQTKDRWELLTKLRQSNRTFVTPQFDYCFLQELTDISATAGREIIVGIDVRSGVFFSKWGDAKGRVGPQDPTNELVLLHTHPRATLRSSPATSHSEGDLSATLLFYVAHRTEDPDLEIATTVTGRVCGGKMETSTIALSHDVLYVTSEAALKAVQQYFQSIISSQDIIRSVRDMLQKIKLKVNAGEVKRIAKTMRLSSKTHADTLRYFREGP